MSAGIRWEAPRRWRSPRVPSPRRLSIPVSLIAFLVLCPLGAQESSDKREKLDLKAMFEKGIPESPFIAVVYRYADAMLKHGRDTRGPIHTELFLGALDRDTLSPLTDRPPAPAGVPPGRRPGRAGQALRGANPQLDENLLRLLYFLRGLSGQDRYPRAADQELKWFLENARSPGTGLHAWGEHHSWETFTDEVAGPSGAAPEFCRPWMLWARCFELAPEASAGLARSLRERALSADGEPDPRQAGFLIRTWAEAHAHTGDSTFTEAIDLTLRRLEGRRRSGPASAYLSLAIDCDGAARRVPEPLRTRLGRHAAREDELFCALPHELESSGGFVLMSSAAGDEARGRSPLWDPRVRGETTARVAMMCVSRYENTGRLAYRDLIVAAARAYLDSLPGAGDDAWPMTFGQAISLELSAFRITADRKYFQRAFALGELAVREFFGDSPLPRASLGTRHYESTTGADTLVLALAELHLTTRTITAVRAPVNTIDR